MQGRGSDRGSGRDFKTLARAQKGFRQCEWERGKESGDWKETGAGRMRSCKRRQRWFMKVHETTKDERGRVEEGEKRSRRRWTAGEKHMQIGKCARKRRERGRSGRGSVRKRALRMTIYDCWWRTHAWAERYLSLSISSFLCVCLAALWTYLHARISVGALIEQQRHIDNGDGERHGLQEAFITLRQREHSQAHHMSRRSFTRTSIAADQSYR